MNSSDAPSVSVQTRAEQPPSVEARTSGGGPPRSGSRRGIVIAFVVVSLLAVGAWYVREQQLRASLKQQCRTFSEQQRWPDLARAARQWAQHEPKNADPWVFLAEAAEEQSLWEDAVAALGNVPQVGRTGAVAWLRKGTIEFEYLNRPFDGVRSCDTVLKIDPRVMIAHKQSIFFHAMTLQRGEMVRRIREAIRVRRESPESYVFLISATWLYSGSLYRHNTHWLKNDPNNEMFRVAQALQIYASEAKDDLDVAEEFRHIPVAEELLQQYPHNPELIAFFLKRSVSDGDRDRVHELLSRVPRDIADKDPRFWRARAWIAEIEGDLSAAEQALRAAYGLDPYWWQVHHQLQEVLRKLGRRDEAAEFLKLYEVSQELAVQISTLNRSDAGFDDPKFCRSLLKLAEMVHDEQVAEALRLRLSIP